MPEQNVLVDLNLKLRLEKQLRIKINAFHERQVKKMIRTVRDTGDVPNFSADEQELERILFQHYENVGVVFINQINSLVLTELEKELTPVDEKAIPGYIVEMKARKKLPKVPVVVDKHFKVKAANIAGKITKTTQKEAKRVLAAAKKTFEKGAKVGVVPVDLASTSGKMFRTTLNGRASGIVRMNTNGPAEAVKLTQVQVLRGEEPSLGGAGGTKSKGTKRWSNMADSLVRGPSTFSEFNHQTANQTVKIDEAFIVSGEQLRFPGDDSMGASLGNIINCRCAVSYNIKKIAKKVKKKAVSTGKFQAKPKPKAKRKVKKPIPKPKPKAKRKPRPPKDTLPRASTQPEFQSKNLGKELHNKKYNKFETSGDTMHTRIANEQVGDRMLRSVDEYVGDSELINIHAREGKVPRFMLQERGATAKQVERAVADIDDAISIGRVQEDSILYRGTRGRSARNGKLKVGSKFKDKAFGSWSGEETTAAVFMEEGSGVVAKDAMIYRMKVKKGTQALFIDGSETEFLFQRNMIYEIVSIEKNVPVGFDPMTGGVLRRDVATVVQKTAKVKKPIRKLPKRRKAKPRVKPSDEWEAGPDDGGGFGDMF